MLENLKQFVPSQVCLSCDGCCRFKEEKSAWRPKVGAAERKHIVVDGASLADRVLSKKYVDEENSLKTVPCHGLHVCTFFNPEDHTCGIYQRRPFECRLYPFILAKKEGEIVVYAHGNCPHVQQYRQHPSFQDYVKYLKKYFAQSEVIEFLRQNPFLAGDYSAYESEMEYLFEVDRLR